MNFPRIPTSCLVLILSASLCGCGTVVPQIEEIWDIDGSSKTLERKIKEQIFCELQAAVYRINVKDKDSFVSVNGKLIPPIPETWGATITITLTVLENSALNPGVAFNTPIIPGTSYFPGKVTVPGPQSYSLGLGGTLSSDATRVDKYTFFYLVSDLEIDTNECKLKSATFPDGRDPKDFQGSSLLLESDLGIYKWLNNAMDLRVDTGISRKSQQEVLSYDVKFDIVSSGNVTPTWKLVRVTTSSANLFSTKRERTHELSLTFGPVQTPSATQDKSKKKQPAQPGVLATNDALATQIGSAVAIGIKNSLSP